MAYSTFAWATSSTFTRQQSACFGSAVCERKPMSVQSRSRTGSSQLLRATLSPEVGSSVTGDENEWNGETIDTKKLISQVRFNKDGLVPAIAQQFDTNEVLMMAWMNEESLNETVKKGRVVYYSRSRQELWRKGDTSGQVQYLKDFILDCDGDTILLKVNQVGVACHTGRRSCFYFAFRPPHGEPEIIEDVLIDPKKMYGTPSK